MNTPLRLGSGLLLCLVATTARAQADYVQVHGFGTWSYGITNQNAYSTGTPEGEYDHTELAVNLVATPMERLTIGTQLFWSIALGEKEAETELDFAFAEYAFFDTLRVRGGRVKHPFGLYAEIFDVGILRPFISLPLSIYGDSGVAAESYSGLGLTGIVTGGAWELAYDLYGGELNWELEEPYEEEADPAMMGGEEEENSPKNLLGGRATVALTEIGLRGGVSAYAGEREDTEALHFTAGAHLEYQAHGALLRAEFVYSQHDHGEDEEGKTAAKSAYAEAAYHILEPVQLAVRYDWHAEDPEGVDLDGRERLVHHRAASVGVNYWFGPNAVFKIAYHGVTGSRFVSALEEGALPKRRTDLLEAGLQFGF